MKKGFFIFLSVVAFMFFNTAALHKACANSYSPALTQKLKALNTASDSTKLNLYQDVFWLYFKEDFEKTSPIADSIIALAKRINHQRGLAGGYRNKARYYFENKNFVEALNYFYKALNLYQHIGYTKGEINVCHDLGVFYSEANIPIKAIEFLNRTNEFREQDHPEKPKTYFMLSYSYLMADSLEKAEYFFDKYLQIANKADTLKHKLFQLIFELDKAMRLSNYNHSLLLIDSIKQLKTQINLSGFESGYLMLAQAVALIETTPANQPYPQQAFELLQKAKTKGKNLDIYNMVEQACKYLEMWYLSQNNYKTAYEVHTELDSFLTHYKEQRNLMQVSILTQEYENRAQQQKLAMLTAGKKNLSLQLQNKKQNENLLALGVVATVLVGALLLLLYLRAKRYSKLLSEQNLNLNKLNQQLMQTNSELDHFVYRTSHDLRAPLLSVKGLLTLTQQENNPTQRHEYLELAQKSLNKLDMFISDIISYSKTKHRNNQLEKETINIREVIDDLLSQLHFVPGYQQAKIEIKMDVNDTVNTDRMLLEQVLKNLLSNAIKYAAAYTNQPHVCVNIQQTPQTTTIQIADNGPGVHPSYQTKIFEMFERADAKASGSGLGLYIARQAAQKLKAVLTYTPNKQSKGSIFTLTLPH